MPLICPQCRYEFSPWRNPAPTVDVVIMDAERGVLLIRRANPPLGYALPGGFVDEGESVEHAAVREALEETGLVVRLTALLGVYSNPKRDLRKHTMSTVFLAQAEDLSTLKAGDDAADAGFFSFEALPELVFDHARILTHAKAVLCGERPAAAISERDDNAPYSE